MKRTARPLACLALVLAICFSNIQAVEAAGNGLRISPVRADVVINPGESKTVPVRVTNITTAPAELKAIINDFTGNADETGNPAIILDPNEYAPSHSLKRFVAPLPNLSLKPGEQKTIDVKISVPKNASAGGYFGAVRFAPAQEGGDSTVTLAGSVGSLILLKVPGDIKEHLAIKSFDVRKNDSASSFFTTNKDLSAVVRFQNLGNVQVAPFGKIILKNRSGKVLSTMEVNSVTPPGNVLPDSVRKFPVSIKNVGSFGQFKLEGNFGYGADGQLLSASTTFYVIPTNLIIAFILIVLLLVFLVFGMPKLIRAYNRRVIRQAGRARR